MEKAFIALAEAFKKAYQVFAQNKTVNEFEVIDNNDLSTLDAIHFLVRERKIKHQEFLNPEKNTFTLIELN